MPTNRKDLRLCLNHPHSTMCTCVSQGVGCYTLVFQTEDTFCFVGGSICATHWVKLLGADSRFIFVALGLYTQANLYQSSADIQRNNATLTDPCLITPPINLGKQNYSSLFTCFGIVRSFVGTGTHLFLIVFIKSIIIQYYRFWSLLSYLN